MLGQLMIVHWTYSAEIFSPNFCVSTVSHSSFSLSVNKYLFNNYFKLHAGDCELLKLPSKGSVPDKKRGNQHTN